MDKTTLDHARNYVLRGFSVIPLKARSKIPDWEVLPLETDENGNPVIDDETGKEKHIWKPYQRKIASDEELKSWFGNGSKRNIGIVTGAISGIAAVDLDGEAAVKYARANNFPKTPLVKTGKIGGYHAYCQYKDGVRNFQKRDDLPGIDLRGDGGYVVAPPSIHPSGAQYHWVNGKGLDDLPFAELPEIVLSQQPEDKTPIKDLYKGKEKGNRNDTLARLTGSWVNDRLSFDECLENASLWNSKNRPPLPEREIERTVKSIFEKNYRERGTALSQPIDKLEWTDPIPFDYFSRLPAFPLEVLPAPGRKMVNAVSEINQVDSGMTASIYLSVLSASMAKKADINLVSHKEPLNIFTCSILPSGNRKSSTMDTMTKPLYEYQATQQEAMQDKIREALNSHRIREARLAKLQKQAANANDAERGRFTMNAAAVAKEISENPVPIAPLFIVDDVTAEALGIHMAENNERIAVMSTEGGIFEIMAGRYSDKNGNLDLYLKAHSGDSWSSHRVGREARTMQSPSLTMCLTVQPDVIREIGSIKQFRGRGLLARFLYSLCQSQVGYRLRQINSVPDTLLKTYRRHIELLMDIPMTSTTLTLSPDARALWDEFYNDVEADLREGGSLHYLTDWGSKLPGAVARIAGLLHFAEHRGEAVNIPISANIVTASCMIGGYYKEHALATFGLMEVDTGIESAKKILDYLLRLSPSTFKGRDVLRHTSFKTMDEVSLGIKILIERGYIREAEVTRSGMGRPEAMTCEVNPKLKILDKH